MKGLSSFAKDKELEYHSVIRTSPISGAGQGVFLARREQQQVLDDSFSCNCDANDDDSSQYIPLCLYPGVYTPGLPSFTTGDESIVYLANELTPPSGIPSNENAYILNVSQVGGYIDGMALYCPQQQRRFDENPSACARKINHSSREANTVFVPFYWKDVIRGVRGGDHSHTLPHKQQEQCFTIPNAMRSDNSPWYYDNGEIYQITEEKAREMNHLLVGAAACMVETTIVEPGEELFLNYSLKRNPDLPSWAKS